MQAEKFLLIGNDKKLQACRNRLIEKGFTAVCCDGEKLADKIRHYSSIILPIPTLANGCITGTRLTLAELEQHLLPEQKVFYGNLAFPPFGERSISYYNESFLIKNSRLTAQGTLRLILENTDKDLLSLKCAVLGYGRCGRAICKSLSANGIKTVSVSRKPYSAVLAENDGIEAVQYNEFYDKISDFDVIVNTVPHNILGKSSTEKLTKRNLYIEIASKPYGFNINETDKYNFRYILAESLPGRFTPSSAGINIADTILCLIEEGENE